MSPGQARPLSLPALHRAVMDEMSREIGAEGWGLERARLDISGNKKRIEGRVTPDRVV